MRHKLFGLSAAVPFASTVVLACGAASGWEEDFVDYAKLREDAYDMKELLNKIPDQVPTIYKSSLPSSIGPVGLIVSEEQLGIELKIQHATIKPEFTIADISNKQGKLWIQVRLINNWIFRQKKIIVYDYHRKIQIENRQVVAFINDLEEKKTSKTKSIPSEVSDKGKTTPNQLGLVNLNIPDNWDIEWEVMGYDDPGGRILLKITITVDNILEGYHQFWLGGYRKMSVPSQSAFSIN